MRLLETSTFELKEFFDANIPEYAILSHRWGEDEVTFKQMLKRTAPPGQGLRKIQKCCSLAASNGFRWAWIDTCCIDKRSSSELTEAINSMYEWYNRAAVCYVYLNDVRLTAEELRLKGIFMRGEWRDVELDVDYHRMSDVHSWMNETRWQYRFVLRPDCEVGIENSQPTLEEVHDFCGFFSHDCSSELRERFRASNWFTRGWTLQELLAPLRVLFFDADWHEIGTRTQLAADVATVLGSVTEREVMSWDPEEIKERR